MASPLIFGIDVTEFLMAITETVLDLLPAEWGNLVKPSG